jgi:hypothetical protein
VQHCDILPQPQKTYLGQISLSPWLNPVTARESLCLRRL